MSNALKFTDEGGNVKVSVSVESSEKHQLSELLQKEDIEKLTGKGLMRHAVLIEVRDNG
eukprot:CAMPEP_0170510806 /NCGR_PEP_ID=MMETSP0208-20121228/65962_1 /TAXON_ID=197538 /ORGANISM="Strombidium inclinatum, Strain S3" /LENGTH=58 /DNA_ID=CAMNT_0010794293 /DNA_START=1366 /DNA_END=1542 /DNA_ORIENTATION=-